MELKPEVGTERKELDFVHRIGLLLFLLWFPSFGVTKRDQSFADYAAHCRMARIIRSNSNCFRVLSINWNYLDSRARWTATNNKVICAGNRVQSASIKWNCTK